MGRSKYSMDRKSAEAGNALTPLRTALGIQRGPSAEVEAKSVLPSATDVKWRDRHFRFVPETDSRRNSTVSANTYVE